MAFTVIEVLIAMALSGIAIAAIMTSISGGLKTVTQARDSFRATQIMAQKLEVIRLFTWTQLNDTNFLATNSFTEVYDPLATASTNQGIIYSGIYKIADFPYPVTYSNALKLLTVQLTWTNGTIVNSNRVTIPYVHTRTMDTVICSNGLQRYIF
jgi:type II secretory pathway pseudopilin PulG